MFRFLNNRFVQLTVVAVAFFLVLLAILPTNRLIELMNSIFIFVVVAVAIVLAPGVWRAVSNREFDRVSQAAVGIVCFAVSAAISRIANVAGRVVGGFDGIANSPLIAVAIYFAIIGSILLMTAPGMVDGRWRYNRGLVFAALIAGVSTAVTVYFLQIQVLQ